MGLNSPNEKTIHKFREEIQYLRKIEDEITQLINHRQVELEHLSESNSQYPLTTVKLSLDGCSIFSPIPLSVLCLHDIMLSILAYSWFVLTFPPTHSYVTYQDIRGITSFKDQIVICIKAPQDTKLEVPDPGEVICFSNFYTYGCIYRKLSFFWCYVKYSNLKLFSKQKIQILLKSTRGEIDVFLCPDPMDVANPEEASSPSSIESLEDDLLSPDSETCTGIDSGL